MKKILVVNGVTVLTLDFDASEMTVGSEDGEDLIPIAEYLEATINSELEYDAVSQRLNYEWKFENQPILLLDKQFIIFSNTKFPGWRIRDVYIDNSDKGRNYIREDGQWVEVVLNNEDKWILKSKNR